MLKREKYCEFPFSKSRISHILPHSNFKMSISYTRWKDEKDQWAGTEKRNWMTLQTFLWPKPNMHSCLSHMKFCFLNSSCNVILPCFFTCCCLIPRVLLLRLNSNIFCEYLPVSIRTLGHSLTQSFHCCTGTHSVSFVHHLLGSRHWASLVTQWVKNPLANAGDTDLIPRLGRSPGEGNGNTFQYSCLRNPMDRGARQGIAHGVEKALKMTWQLSNNKGLF